MQIAQIVRGKVHSIFVTDSIPEWPPDPGGNPIVLVDITDQPGVKVGWLYDPDTGTFTEPPELEPSLPQPEPPTLEEMLAQTLLNTEFLAILAEISHL